MNSYFSIPAPQESVASLRLQGYPLLPGVELVAAAIFHQLQRDRMLQRRVSLRSRAEHVVVAHVHDVKLSVGRESETVLARRQRRSANVELDFGDQHSLIF